MDDISYEECRDTLGIEVTFELAERIRVMLKRSKYHRVLTAKDVEKCDELAKNLEAQTENIMENKIMWDVACDQTVRYAQQILVEYKQWYDERNGIF